MGLEALIKLATELKIKYADDKESVIAHLIRSKPFIDYVGDHTIRSHKQYWMVNIDICSEPMDHAGDDASPLPPTGVMGLVMNLAKQFKQTFQGCDIQIRPSTGQMFSSCLELEIKIPK